MSSKKIVIAALLATSISVISCTNNDESRSVFGIGVEDQRYSGSPTGDRKGQAPGERNPSGRTSSNLPDNEYSNTTPGQPSAPEGKGAEDGTTGAATGEPGMRGGSYGSGAVEQKSQ